MKLQKHISEIVNLEELLAITQSDTKPLFVNLCGSQGYEDHLMDQVLLRLQQKHAGCVDYLKFCGVVAADIRQELRSTKKPIVLLINQGQIEAIFGGINPPYVLEEAYLNIARKDLCA